MGQQDIYTFLKGHKNRWYDAYDLAKHLKAEYGAMTKCLRKLYKNNDIYKDTSFRPCKFKFRQ